MSVKNTVYINSFLVEANKLKTEGIFLNKDYIKDLNINKVCKESAKLLLGSAYNRLTDSTSAKLFLKEILSEEDFAIFRDGLTMGLTYSLERLLIVHSRLDKRNDDLANTVLGVIYYMAGDIFENEFKNIFKACSGNRLTPAFTLSASSFKWGRCPHVLKKYMLKFTQPMGYDAYYYERPNLAHLSFLTSDVVKMDVDLAEDTISKLKGGLFFKDLSPNLENRLMHDILLGGYDTMDGKYAGTVLSESIKLEDELGINTDISGLYNHHLKPLMIEFIGRVISEVRDDVKRNTDLDNDVFKIYHVSPQRFGILVKEGMDLKGVLPNYHHIFKKVTGVTPKGLVMGEYL